MLLSYAKMSSGSPEWSLEWLVLLLCPFALVSGALLLRWRFRIGYVIAGIGALLPLPWFFTTESRHFANSWIAMNFSGEDPDLFSVFGYMRYFQLRIISAALLLATLVWACIRLLPPDWRFRNRPLRQRTWPAVAISFAFTGYWFLSSVFPYRQPIIVDAVPAELSILNVKRDGLTFHETRVTIYRDSRYYVFSTDRRLFHYSFVESAYEGLLTDDLRRNLSVVLSLPELKETPDKSPHAIRSLHGEGWYTEMGSFRVAAFSNENGIRPPQELIMLFQALVGTRATGLNSIYAVRDVCLGFCYDPKAGLGYRAENQRCGYSPDGKGLCY